MMYPGVPEISIKIKINSQFKEGIEILETSNEIKLTTHFLSNCLFIRRFILSSILLISSQLRQVRNIY